MNADPGDTPQAESGGARNVLIGAVALLIGVMLVAAGFIGRVAIESGETGDTNNVAEQPAPSAGAEAAGDFTLLNEIVDILEQDFVDEDRVDPGYLRQGAINGLFEALGDPHSSYVDPETYAISRNEFEGAFQGIGATVAQQDRFIVIINPLPGTPAEAAGIEAGDLILEVDGESAEGWSVEQAVTRIRGPQGSSVDLQIRHSDGTEELITVVRDEIEVSSVSVAPPAGELLDEAGEPVDDVAYMRIRSFTRDTPQELEAAVAEAESAGVSGLILDVRSNPGGLLAETTEVADLFLDEGPIVYQVYRDGSEQSAVANEGQITGLPIVVVQDEFSASGAELLAAALQENDRATVVGAASFGKGTVNHVRELSNGGAVYVSIARWLTPDRNQIEGRGVTPDVEIEVTLEDIENQRDLALIRAVEVLREEAA